MYPNLQIIRNILRPDLDREEQRMHNYGIPPSIGLTLDKATPSSHHHTRACPVEHLDNRFRLCYKAQLWRNSCRKVPECAVRQAADEVPEVWRDAITLQLCFTRGFLSPSSARRTSYRLWKLQKHSACHANAQRSPNLLPLEPKLG